MAAHIADGYNDGGVCLLEAGTGVGKSLGYLVPALRWARANGERTVVSTNTINLQEQLVGKDLPFLRDALGTEDQRRVRAAQGLAQLSLPARACTRRWRPSATLFEPDKPTSSTALARWAERTADGSLSDLPCRRRPEVWDEVSAEPDLCTRLKCATSTTASCSARAARRRRPT